MSEENQGPVGIQETKEALEAVGALGAVLAVHLKDGFQAGKDVPAIAADLFLKPDVREAMQRAGDGIQNVPAEMKDIDAAEAMELAQVGISTVKEILTALK